MTELFNLVYCSRSRIAGAADEVDGQVQDILALSRANNSRDGLTGGLLLNAECLAQVLEGPAPAVESAFARIRQDRRHDQVTVLHAGPIARRDFPDWSMAFVGTGDDPFAARVIHGALRSPAALGIRVLDMMRDVLGQAAKAAAA